MFSTNISSLRLHNSFIIFINTVDATDRPLTGHRPVSVREHTRSMRRSISTPSTSNRPSTSATSWDAIHPATPSVRDTHGNNYTELCMYNFMLHLPHKYFCLFITVAIHLYHDIVKKSRSFRKCSETTEMELSEHSPITNQPASTTLFAKSRYKFAQRIAQR